jgi:prophage antirepressor-like protein
MLKHEAGTLLPTSANCVQVFNNTKFGEVRVTENGNGEPLFCLTDICKSLELSPKGVNQRLSGEVISNYPIIDGLGRKQLALFVSEDGLYDVILDSRKPEAKLFRDRKSVV